jgi:hypothetical protein
VIESFWDCKKCRRFAAAQEAIAEKKLIENALLLGTFEIPKSYIQKAAKLYYGEHRRFRFPEKLEFKLFLV